jgi:hypothetical protein
MLPTIAAYTRLGAWRLAGLEGRSPMTDPLNGRGHPTPEYAFKVKLVAVVRVRAANETVARRVLPSVLSSPGTVDIMVANENNAALGVDALVTDVDFAIEESAALFEVDGTIIKQG